MAKIIFKLNPQQVEEVYKQTKPRQARGGFGSGIQGDTKYNRNKQKKKDRKEMLNSWS